DTATSSSSCHMDRGDDIVTLIHDLLEGDLHLVPAIEPVLPDPQRASDAWGERVVVLEGEPLDLRMQSASEGISIAVECCHPPLHQLHVLLRHRLIRESGGFEGVGLSAIEAELRDFGAADLEEKPEVLLHADAAAFPLCHLADPNQDAVTQIDELLGKHPPVAEILRPVCGCVEESGLTVVRRAIRVGAVGGDIVGEQIEQCFEFAALESLAALTDDLHLLLRHQPRSISRHDETNPASARLAPPQGDHGARAAGGMGGPGKANLAGCRGRDLLYIGAALGSDVDISAALRLKVRERFAASLVLAECRVDFLGVSVNRDRGALGEHDSRRHRGDSRPWAPAGPRRAARKPPRLLPQPGGFEGLAAIEVVPDLDDPPLVKRADRRSVCLHDYSALTASGDLVDEDDQLITGVDDLLRSQFESLPGVVVVPERFNDLSAAPKDASLVQSPGRPVPLDIGVVEVPQGRLEVTPLQSREPATDCPRQHPLPKLRTRGKAGYPRRQRGSDRREASRDPLVEAAAWLFAAPEMLAVGL